MLVLTLVVAVVVVLSAVADLANDPRALQACRTIGFPTEKMSILAGLKIGGGLGAVLGLWVKPLGVAALVGLSLYFVGAVVAHLRVKDVKGTGPAALLLVLVVVAAIVRISA